MKTNTLSVNRILNPTGWLLLILLTLILSTLSFVSLDKNQTLPLWIATLISGILGYIVVPILQKIKASQIIQEDGPQSHLKKSWNSYNGGNFFIPTGLIIALIMANFSPNVIALVLLTFAYSFIGWVDDWQILRKKTNLGLTPKQKLILQVGFAIIFLCLDVFHSTGIYHKCYSTIQHHFASKFSFLVCCCFCHGSRE